MNRTLPASTRRLLLLLLLLLSAPVSRGAEPVVEIRAALSGLARARSYAWRSTLDLPGAPFTPGPTLGQTERDGFTLIRQEINGQVIEAVHQGTNAVLRTEQGWRNAGELRALSRDDTNAFTPARMVGRLLLAARTPDQELAGLIDAVTAWRREPDGHFTGELSAEGARALFGAGRRPRGTPDPGAPGRPLDARGAVQVWVRDGRVTRYAVGIAGTVGTGPEQRRQQRAALTDLSGFGTTRVEVPPGARERLAGSK